MTSVPAYAGKSLVSQIEAALGHLAGEGFNVIGAEDLKMEMEGDMLVREYQIKLRLISRKVYEDRPGGHPLQVGGLLDRTMGHLPVWIRNITAYHKSKEKPSMADVHRMLSKYPGIGSPAEVNGGSLLFVRDNNTKRPFRERVRVYAVS